METVRFHLSEMDLFLRNIMFSIGMVSLNRLTSMGGAAGGSFSGSTFPYGY